MTPHCRICGCTRHNPCPGGCAWALPGLCSNPDCIDAAYRQACRELEIAGVIEAPAAAEPADAVLEIPSI